MLTAIQVGLAKDRLQTNTPFQQASYGFTVFAILEPICAFSLVILAAVARTSRHCEHPRPKGLLRKGHRSTSSWRASLLYAT